MASDGWSPCTKSCGGGFRFREIQLSATETDFEEESCNPQACRKSLDMLTLILKLFQHFILTGRSVLDYVLRILACVTDINLKINQ